MKKNLLLVLVLLCLCCVGCQNKEETKVSFDTSHDANVIYWEDILEEEVLIEDIIVEEILIEDVIEDTENVKSNSYTYYNNGVVVGSIGNEYRNYQYINKNNETIAYKFDRYFQYGTGEVVLRNDLEKSKIISRWYMKSAGNVTVYMINTEENYVVSLQFIIDGDSPVEQSSICENVITSQVEMKVNIEDTMKQDITSSIEINYNSYCLVGSVGWENVEENIYKVNRSGEALVIVINDMENVTVIPYVFEKINFPKER